MIQQKVNVDGKQLATDDLGVVPEVERKVDEQDIEQHGKHQYCSQPCCPAKKQHHCGDKFRDTQQALKPGCVSEIGPCQHPSRYLVEWSRVGKRRDLKLDIDQFHDRVIQHDCAEQIARGMIKSAIDLFKSAHSRLRTTFIV